TARAALGETTGVGDMQQLDPNADCLSNLELDEWLADELDAPTRARFGRHLAGCASCRARRAQFEREAAEFYAEAPSFQRPQLPATAPRGRARGWAVATAVALAAGAALIVWPGLPEPSMSTRAKGAPHLSFFVKRGELVRRGQNGEPVYPGD